MITPHRSAWRIVDPKQPNPKWKRVHSTRIIKVLSNTKEHNNCFFFEVQRLSELLGNMLFSYLLSQARPLGQSHVVLVDGIKGSKIQSHGQSGAARRGASCSPVLGPGLERMRMGWNTEAVVGGLKPFHIQALGYSFHLFPKRGLNKE